MLIATGFKVFLYKVIDAGSLYFGFCTILYFIITVENSLNRSSKMLKAKQNRKCHSLSSV